ncbi:MAG TPA: hypothetical protein VL400_08425, partial [Polyangiaceae bacterium]|nr:hypothetical protein [Polyangiaceae bacterium]
MSKRGLWLCIVAALALPVTGGCDKINELTGAKKDDSKSKKKKSKDKDEESESEEEASAKPAASESAAPAASESAAPAASNDTAPTASGTAPPPMPTGPIAGHSAVPTQQEWEGVGEVTVTGSGKLNCETKAIREWVRVSCKGKNDTGGTPTGVSIDKGGGKGDTFTFISGGVASLVYPFADGQDIAATFTWTDKSAKFTSQWPHGAPKPAAFGKFEETAAAATPKADTKPTPT